MIRFHPLLLLPLSFHSGQYLYLCFSQISEILFAYFLYLDQLRCKPISSLVFISCFVSSVKLLKSWLHTNQLHLKQDLLFSEKEFAIFIFVPNFNVFSIRAFLYFFRVVNFHQLSLNQCTDKFNLIRV